MNALPLSKSREAPKDVKRERDGDDDPEHILPERDGESGHSDDKSPQKNFAGDGLAPARSHAARWNTRTPGGPEFWNDAAKFTEGLALGGGEARFFKGNQTKEEKRLAEDKYEKADTAGEKAEANSEQDASQIKRIAKMAVRAFGDKLFRMQRFIVNDVRLQVCRRPSAKSGAEKHDESCEGEKRVDPIPCCGRARADEFRDKKLDEVGLVDAIGAETEEVAEADQPEAVAKLEIGCAKH